ncbi:MAG: PepSY-like domain-containing protein [Tannerellaceae bacterium]
MKTKFSIFAMLCLLFMGVNTSCSNDDDKDKQFVTPEAEKAFNLQYPNAKNVKWEMKNTYYVAEFNEASYKSIDAWYNAAGEWFLSEYDIAYDANPSAVQTTFSNSAYGKWTVDDVDLIRRPSFMDLYIIDADDPNSENDVDVYISADGILIKSVIDSDNNPAQPIVIPSIITDAINSQYPKASIVDFDQEENGNYQVDIIFESQALEVTFDSKYNWLYTDSEIQISAVPSVVKDAVNTKYPGYSIDNDVTLRTMPTPPYQYVFELEKTGTADITAIFDANGTFIK